MELMSLTPSFLWYQLAGHLRSPSRSTSVQFQSGVSDRFRLTVELDWSEVESLHSDDQFEVCMKKRKLCTWVETLVVRVWVGGYRAE